MAISFSTVETTQWIGQVIGKPTQLCGKDGRVVLVNIDWRIYQLSEGENLGLEVDMTGIAPSNQLDLIRSVYIDNIGSPTTIYVFFPDTQFTAICPPYSYGWFPVVTFNRRAIIYGVGFTTSSIPLTNVFFTNIYVPLGVRELGPELNVTPALATFLGTAFNGTSQTNYTFNAFDIGTAFPSRRIVVAVQGGAIATGFGLPSATLTSVTLGGNPMTSIVQTTGFTSGWSGFEGTDMASEHRLALFIIAEPAGVTANIGVNWSAARGYTRISAWSIEGIITDNVASFASISQGSFSSGTGLRPPRTNQAVNNTLNAPARSCLIGAGMSFAMDKNATIVPVGAMSLTGLAQDAVDFNSITGAVNRYSAFGMLAAHTNNIVVAQPSYPIDMLADNTNVAALVSAAFQPS